MAAALVALWTSLVATPVLAAASVDSPPSADASLDTIVVQGQKLSVETKIDRKVYTVPEEAQSIQGSLSDVLSAIPSVDVDPDGVVSLRGDANVLILIDGKPATLFQGSKAGENLQSISAQNIERIEILTTPPAQFKAEGVAGVINIITRKRGAKQSASAALQGSFGDGGRGLVSANANYGSKQFSAAINGGFRQDYRQRTVQSHVTGADPATGQVLESRDFANQHLRRNIPSADVSVEYDPTSRQTLSASGSWLRRGGLRTYTQFDDGATPSGALKSSTQRSTRGHDPENDYNAALRFSQKLSKPGETLDLSLHRSISHQHEHYDYLNDSFVPSTPAFYDNLDFTEDHGVTEAGLDYALPLSKTDSLKLGYAFEQDDYGFNTAGADVDPVSGAQTIVPALTNDFRFQQRIHAIYLSEQGSIAAWSWLTGLRAEWTTTEALGVTNNFSITSRYADVFPSLHIDRALTDRSTLSFGASRRVTRPNPSYLDPYVFDEYPPNSTAGNPKLRPQFTQSFEAGYGYTGRDASYALTGYFRRNSDSVTDTTEYLGNGLSVTTKTNLPKSDSSGLEFSATGQLLSKVSYSVSGDAFHSQIDASALGIPGLRATTGLNTKAKLDYRPTVADSAQISFTRTDKRLTPQGSISAINIVNLGYKRAITKALSGVVTVSDLLEGQRYQRIAVTSLFSQRYERSVEGRVIFFGLVYKFGVTREDKQSNFDFDSGG